MHRSLSIELDLSSPTKRFSLAGLEFHWGNLFSQGCSRLAFCWGNACPIVCAGREGSRLLPSYRATILQSGSPPGDTDLPPCKAASSHPQTTPSPDDFSLRSPSQP